MSFVKLPEKSPIYNLQTMLRTVLPDQLIHPDGIFGAETKAAICTYQKQHALTVTGEADLKTWESLIETYQQELIRQAKAEVLQIVLQPNQTIKKDEANLHLYLIQSLFLALSELYLELPRVRVTGKNDAQTQNAISWLQRKSDLPQTGELDKATWQQLTHQYRSAVGDGSGCYPIRKTGRTLAPAEHRPLDDAAKEK